MKVVPRFGIGDKGRAGAFYKQNGFVVFRGFATPVHMADVGIQIQALIQSKIDRMAMGAVAPKVMNLPASLERIYKHNRADFVHILDAGHSLPALFRLSGDPRVCDLLKVVGINQPMMRMLPGIRIDTPGETEYLHADLQDCQGNGGSESAVVCWIPLTESRESAGIIKIRPGSHVLGALSSREIAVRPYILLQRGAWEKRYPSVSVPLKLGDIIVCHMHTIYRVEEAQGGHPRISLQLRYNNAEDAGYRSKGWPLTFRVVSRKDKILLRTYAVK